MSSQLSSSHVAGLDWDEGNRAKCGKHGLTVAETEDVFRGELWIAPDPRHSSSETRLIAVGRASGGRWVFVAFIVRRVDGRDLIRPISARYMHAKQIAQYEARSS